MHTERFHKIRKEVLDKIFEKKNIVRVWRNIVKDQLRNIDIKDLYDYYDFTFNIEERAQNIRFEILNGNYSVALPLIYKVEKKYGVCRHIIVPQPIDALILQVITEVLSKEIISKQPSKNAFYSQDKHNVAKPHQVESDEYGFNWRKLWKQMQLKIYQFNEDKELLIVSDLTNYYDCIDVNILRSRISNMVDDKEVLLDILFKIIEGISWKPDYLPYTGRALPTTNLEGVRLLAHSFLFEIDSILKDKSNDSFTRWMDDIVIGVNTRKEAIETISSISDVLKSRGLALNLSKTNIYNSTEAEYHFQIQANKYLDSVNYSLKGKELKALEKELYSKFKEHLNDKKPKYWDKISKRYLTAFSKLKSKVLLKSIDKYYDEYPVLRPNLLYYLFEQGYNKKTAKSVLSILVELHLYDDISLFQICKLVTDWIIPKSDESITFLKEFEKHLYSFSEKRKKPFDFYCLLWFKSKYSHPVELHRFISKYENIWRSSSFLNRQAIAIMARLMLTNQDKTVGFLNQQIAIGNQPIVSLATQILYFGHLAKMAEKTKMYLFPTNSKPNVYPLAKFLVLCNLLSSEEIRSSDWIKPKIKEYIKDPYYLHWIETQYNI